MIRKITIGDNKTGLSVGNICAYNELNEANKNENEANNFGFKVKETFQAVRNNFNRNNKFALMINEKEKTSFWTETE